MRPAGWLADGLAPTPTGIDRIIAMAANAFGVAVDDLVGPGRQAWLVRCRQITMAVCREMTAASYPVIGREFGNRDHTTVIHALRRVAADPAMTALARRLADEVRKPAPLPPVPVPERHRRRPSPSALLVDRGCRWVR